MNIAFLDAELESFLGVDFSEQKSKQKGVVQIL